MKACLSPPGLVMGWEGLYASPRALRASLGLMEFFLRGLFSVPTFFRPWIHGSPHLQIPHSPVRLPCPEEKTGKMFLDLPRFQTVKWEQASKKTWKVFCKSTCVRKRRKRNFRNERIHPGQERGSPSEGCTLCHFWRDARRGGLWFLKSLKNFKRVMKIGFILSILGFFIYFISQFLPELPLTIFTN